MQLIFIAHRCRATFEIRDVTAFFSDDQSAFELARFAGINPEIRRQIQRAAHAFGNVNETAIRKDRTVEGGVIIVFIRNNRTEIFFDQIRVIFDRFAKRTKNDPDFRQLFLVRRANGNTIKDRIDRDAANPLLF